MARAGPGRPMGERQGGPLERSGAGSRAPYQGGSGRRRTARLADQSMLDDIGTVLEM